jgi:hypothetical protein
MRQKTVLHSHSEAGVTLMEMLVASVVMLFVMSGLAVILVSTTKIQAYQNELAEAQQNMRIVLSLTGDRASRAGTGLMPHTLSLQTAEELGKFSYVTDALADAGLAESDLVFGAYYQRDFPGEMAGAGVPILDRLTLEEYSSQFGWQGDLVHVKARTGFTDADWTPPGQMPLLAYNVKLGNTIIADSGLATTAKLQNLYTSALHFTRLAAAPAENTPTDSISTIQLLHQPPTGAYPSGWTSGKAPTGDTPILVYVGIAHAVFAYKQETPSDGPPGGNFYMAEFTPSTSNNVAEVEGQFDLYAENVYGLEAIAVFRDPNTGTAIRARMFPAPMETVATTAAISSGDPLEDHYVNRVNLREIEISVTVRTGEPVPAGRMEGLFVPAANSSFVYRVVRGSTRSHMQSFYMDYSFMSGAKEG